MLPGAPVTHCYVAGQNFQRSTQIKQQTPPGYPTERVSRIGMEALLTESQIGKMVEEIKKSIASPPF